MEEGILLILGESQALAFAAEDEEDAAFEDWLRATGQQVHHMRNTKINYGPCTTVPRHMVAEWVQRNAEIIKFDVWGAADDDPALSPEDTRIIEHYIGKLVNLATLKE